MKRHDSIKNTKALIFSKKIRWWHFLIVGFSIANIALFSWVGIGVGAHIINEQSDSRELPMAFSDWMGGGHCAIYEEETDNLNLPNGSRFHCFDGQGRSFLPIAFSENELLSACRYQNNTYLIITDWEYNIKKSLLSLEGDWKALERTDGIVELQRKASLVSDERYEIDIQNASIRHRALSSEEALNIRYVTNEDYAALNISESRLNAEFADGIAFTIPSDRINQELRLKMQEWDFRPHRVRKFRDGVVFLSFARSLEHCPNGGLGGYVIISIDKSGQIDGYQFFMAGSSYDSYQESRNSVYRAIDSVPHSFLME